MANCPFCKEELSSDELQAKLCMSCGNPLPSSTPSEEKAGVGKSPADGPAGPAPLSPQRPDDQAMPDSGKAPPAAEGESTQGVDDGPKPADTADDQRIAETFAGPPVTPSEQPPQDARFATTIGSEGKFLSPDDGPPKQDPRLAETMQTDQQFVPSGDGLPGTPPPDATGPPDSDQSGETADDKRFAATVQSGGGFPQVPAELPGPPQEEQDERIAATLDSGSIGITPPVDGKDSGGPPDISATMDSGDSSRYSQTLDSGDSARFEQTIDSGDSSRFAQTLDSGSVGSVVEERVSMVWSGTFQPETTPRTSIKADAANLESQSHIVIKPRVMVDTQDTAVGRADYEVLSKLGEGGMGVVYAARQSSIDRTVAVKMLKPDSSENKEERGKFLSEAVVTGDLEHPNIVPIYDLGKREDGALFYSMKRVKGTPWDTVIKEKTFAENIEILQKVADAVGFAHSRDVVHRDLKPENVMLGDFGEVLLMDWGLALSSAADPSTTGMGGTPAYMAPEMATGPIDEIGPGADIYLLGAILYEIITGVPPHTGKSVMDCLFAAARNEIIPTEHTGELVSIAMKSMATDQTQRHETVTEFQDAIRDYQSHSESISLSSRADNDLAEAQQTKSYETFARARFGFQEAFELWDGNQRAKAGITEASLAYATSALDKGDYDLGASLLNPKNSQHVELIKKIEEAQEEREARQQRLKTARRIGYVLVATVFIVVTVAFFWIRAEADKARKAEAVAVEEADKARVAEAKATDEADKARKAEVRARDAQRQAVTDAERARLVEADAKLQADRAEKAKEKEEYGAYIARIGLAAAKIEENAFDKAAELLEMCPPRLRDWEWGRLKFLCTRDITKYQADWPLECVAVSPDGKRLATAGWNGRVFVSNVEAEGDTVKLGAGQADEVVIDTGGDFVFGLAFSPDGQFLATGGDSRPHYVQIWNAQTGELVKQLAGPQGHKDTVLSVKFSQKEPTKGRYLLTTSYDQTARLWDLETGEVKVFVGHGWWVWSASFSPDEKRIVTASQEGSAIVWSVETGQPGPPFSGHVGPVYSAVFSPDGKHVATAGYDRRILIWDPDEIEPFDVEAALNDEVLPKPKYRSLMGHSATVRSVSFSDDGRLLVSGGYDNTVRVWDVGTGKPLKTLRGHAGRVPSCVFSPDNSQVLSASLDRTAKRWSIEGYEEVRVFRGRVLEGHRDEILGASFSPHGNRVVTASLDRSAKVWDFKTAKELKEFKEGHEFLASRILFFPDAKHIITAATDNTTRIWDVTTGTQKQVLTGTGPSSAVVLSHDGKWLLTGSDDEAERAKVWNVATGKMTKPLGGHNAEVTAVAISPDSKWALTGDRFGRCRCWNTDTWEVTWEARWHTSGITAAHFLPGGERVLTASLDNTVGQWDVRSGENLSDSVLKHPQSVTAMAVSPDGRRILTACADRIVRLWDVNAADELDRCVVDQLADAKPTGEDEEDVRPADRELAQRQSISAIAFDRSGGAPLRAVTVTEDNRVRMWSITDEGRIEPSGGGENVVADVNTTGGLVWSATFSPNGEHLVTVGGDEAQMWDVKLHTPTMRFSRQRSVASAQFSPLDEDYILTGSWDNSARIWSFTTGNAERKLEGGHEAFINSAVYSRDGKKILTASDDHTIKVWNAKEGKILLTLEGHTDHVRSAVFSPDEAGKWVLSASDDMTARIWDATTGECLHKLARHEAAVLCAAFSPSGDRVVTASEDNTARLWDALTGEPVMIEAVEDEGQDAAAADRGAGPGGVVGNAADPDGGPAADVAPEAQGDGQVGGAALAKTKELKLEGHTAAVTSVVFSPLGTRVVTGSADSTAKVWDAKTGNEILTLDSHTQELTTVSFAPDGQSVLTGSRDGTCVLWLAVDWSESVERADPAGKDPAVAVREGAE